MIYSTHLVCMSMHCLYHLTCHTFSLQRFLCLSNEDTCTTPAVGELDSRCDNCKVAKIINDNPGAWGLGGHVFVVDAGQETIQTLSERTGEFPDMIMHRNDIPACFGVNTPLLQLGMSPETSSWQSTVSNLPPELHSLQHQGHRFITIFRKPMFGHPHNYPNALIKSPKLLSMLQVCGTRSDV